jgi:hypothetical protein
MISNAAISKICFTHFAILGLKPLKETCQMKQKCGGYNAAHTAS